MPLHKKRKKKERKKERKKESKRTKLKKKKKLNGSTKNQQSVLKFERKGKKVLCTNLV